MYVCMSVRRGVYVCMSAPRVVTFHRAEKVQMFFHREGGEEDVLLGADAGQTAYVGAISGHRVAVDRTFPA